jgi:hypothetical protein
MTARRIVSLPVGSRARGGASTAPGGEIDRPGGGVQSSCKSRRHHPIPERGDVMFGIGDLFQWERFVTPTVIKVFYWLAVLIAVLLGVAGAVSALRSMAFNPFLGIITLITSLLGAFVGIILARIAAEFVLIVFRINEHLGAIRNRGGQM